MSAPERLTDKSKSILRLIASGHSYAQIVEDQVGLTYLDIFAAAAEALRLGEPRSDYHDRVAAIKSRHPRAYERWTGEEDAELLRLHADGLSATALALRFGRRRSAIRSRIAKLTAVSSDG